MCHQQQWLYGGDSRLQSNNRWFWHMGQVAWNIAFNDPFLLLLTFPTAHRRVFCALYILRPWEKAPVPPPPPSYGYDSFCHLHGFMLITLHRHVPVQLYLINDVLCAQKGKLVRAAANLKMETESICKKARRKRCHYNNFWEIAVAAPNSNGLEAAALLPTWWPRSWSSACWLWLWSCSSFAGLLFSVLIRGVPLTPCWQTGSSPEPQSHSFTCSPTFPSVWTPLFTASWTSAFAQAFWQLSPAVPSKSYQSWEQTWEKRKKGRLQERLSPGTLTYTWIHLLLQGKHQMFSLMLLCLDLHPTPPK